jgi:hypothetical protein
MKSEEEVITMRKQAPFMFFWETPFAVKMS